MERTYTTWTLQINVDDEWRGIQTYMDHDAAEKALEEAQDGAWEYRLNEREHVEAQI